MMPADNLEAPKISKKNIKLTLNQTDSAFIHQVANELDIKETDVLRKGLKLMKAYAEARKQGKEIKMVLESDDTRQELLIL